MVQEEQTPPALAPAEIFKRIAFLLLAAGGTTLASRLLGLSGHQQLAAVTFIASILGVLMFWEQRLGVGFLGLSMLLLMRAMTVEQAVRAAEMPIILFLIGMMIVLGCLEDLGFFSWVVQSIVSLPRLTARRFVAVISVVAALLACAVGEVISTVIIATLVLQVCGRLKINPAPFVIAGVLATNIGGAGAMMGNPVGILIGAKAGFTFGAFLLWAFPVMLVCTAANAALMMLWSRKELALFDERLRGHLVAGAGSLEPRVALPHWRSLLLLGATLLGLAFHHQAETALGLAKNTIFYIVPLPIAAGVIFFRRGRARHYVEHSVDWQTLLFFMTLFAIASTLKTSGVTVLLAKKYIAHFGANLNLLAAGIMASSAIGSAFVDNVVFVAAFSPIIEGLKAAGVAVSPLWWALLYGACFGGNITLIGSTANIVALGMMGKKAHARIGFVEWLKIGLLSALLTGLIAAGTIVLLKDKMPETAAFVLENTAPAAE